MCRRLFNVMLSLFLIGTLLHWIVEAIIYVKLARCRTCDLPQDCICFGNESMPYVLAQ